MRPTWTLVAVVVAGAFCAAQAQAGVYAGLVPGGEPVVVTADAQGLGSVILGTTLECADGSWIPVNGELDADTPSGLPGVPSRMVMSANGDGMFAGRYETITPDATVTVEVGGLLQARMASGWFIATAVAGITTCTSGLTHFIARRDPGVIFGGTTGQSEPLMLRLNPRTHALRAFSFSWSAACNAGGYRNVALDGWRNQRLPLHRGRFARDTEGYGVAGRIHGTSAAGTLWGRDDSCSSPPLHWAAISG